jgi:hypothetical protein
MNLASATARFFSFFTFLVNFSSRNLLRRLGFFPSSFFALSRLLNVIDHLLLEISLWNSLCVTPLLSFKMPLSVFLLLLQQFWHNVLKLPSLVPCSRNAGDYKVASSCLRCCTRPTMWNEAKIQEEDSQQLFQ